MKKHIPVAVRLWMILILVLPGLFMQSSLAQTGTPASADPVEHFFDNSQNNRTPPSLLPYGSMLGQAEVHNLDPLTEAERKSIEAAVDPPAIGVVRDLPAPIRFTLDTLDLPAQGDRLVSGGRLTRINPDTLVWTTSFRSAGAEELRIFFSEGNFPAGVQVNLFSKDDYAFNQAELSGLLDEYGFYTTTVFADQLTLQVVIPVRSLKERLFFTIQKLIHATGRPIPDAPNTGCFEDVNCPYASSYADIGMLKGATAQLTFVVGGSYYICTGGLLTDVRAADLQPFLLTANHCFSTQTSAASLEARFDMYTTSCNGSTNPNIILVNGSNLLATNSQSDFTLVLLKNNPGGSRWYLGWSISTVANDATLHSVHHPDGTPQKYVRGLNKTAPSFTCLPPANFHYTRAIGGATLGGSSGGNIVLPGGYVVGQLYGKCYSTGFNECDYPTYYNEWGKFDVSYNNNNLQYWLYNGGASASIYVPTTSVSYGSGNVGNWYYQNVTVYNSGFAPNYLNVEASAGISGTDASQFTITGSTSLYLAPGTSGTFTIRFNPTSSGAKSATLNIAHNGDNALSPIVIPLSGNAEPCSDIISLGYGGSSNAKTYSKSGTGIWYTSWSNPCGYNTPGNEQIYSIVAPYTGHYSIEVTSTNYVFLDYFWKSGACNGAGWNCIDDVYFTGTYGSMYWTAGNTYYILADGESTALTTQTFYVYYNPCFNSTAITGTGPANPHTYNGGGTGSWFNTSPTPCGYYCPGEERVYSFMAPNTGYYTLEVTNTNGYFVDYMWSTSCGSSGWNCIDDISAPGTYGPMYWISGNTYYILLDDENSVAEPQTFHINPPEPCLGIIPLSCGTSVEFYASGTGVWDNDPCWYSPGAEQVYSFVAPYTGQYSIQVNSGDSWVDYLWKEGSCSSEGWNCISYVYYSGQYGSMSWIAGNTYYIRLDDEDIYPSLHSFSIVCPALCHTCPTYDFLIDPTYEWQTHSASIEANGCKMYRFYGYPGYSYTFKTGCGDGGTANYDTYLELYNSSCVLVAANDDACATMSKLEYTPTEYGDFYLKVRGYMANYGSYSLAYNVCYYAPAQPAEIFGPPIVTNGVAAPFSIDPVPYATSYTWSYSGSGTISGSGTSVTLTATNNAGGVLSVTANNLCGSGSAVTKNVTVINSWLWLAYGTLYPGYWCFAASETIEVAGDALPLIVPNGSSMELVAGQRILIHPGFTVQNGGYLLARIDNNGNYCNTGTKSSTPEETGLNIGHVASGMDVKDQFFKVYPNPTSGDFTLELSDEPAGSKVKVQCYNLIGALITEREIDSGRRHAFSLGDQSPGLYVLKVVQNGKNGTQKIIRY